MSKARTSIQIVDTAQGQPVNVLGAPVVIKSTGEADRLFFADHFVPPGYAVPLHVHDHQDELFYVLEGEITLDSETGSAVAGPGAFVHLPRGVAHGFRNAGPSAGRMLVVSTAGGDLERLFRDLDAAGRDSGFEPSQVPAICTRHGIHMLPAEAA